MTPTDDRGRGRRAAARERRRSVADAPEHEDDSGARNGPAGLAGDALKAAASAAAVGAAVGAARALSARRRHEDDEEAEPEAAAEEASDQRDERAELGDSADQEDDADRKDGEEQEEREPEDREERGPEDRHEHERERQHEPEPRPEDPEPGPEAVSEDEASSEPASRSDLQSIVRQAREVLRELHGADAETVSAVSRTARGWTVGLEVVEMRRIPDSTDVLATYEVELDGDGGVLRFERTHRYNRSESTRERR